MFSFSKLIEDKTLASPRLLIYIFTTVLFLSGFALIPSEAGQSNNNKSQTFPNIHLNKPTCDLFQGKYNHQENYFITSDTKTEFFGMRPSPKTISIKPLFLSEKSLRNNSHSIPSQAFIRYPDIVSHLRA